VPTRWVMPSRSSGCWYHRMPIARPCSARTYRKPQNPGCRWAWAESPRGARRTAPHRRAAQRLVGRTIVGRGRRRRRLRRVAVRASPVVQVPPFVEIAAPGRVVSGEPGGAAVRGAGAGVAKVLDERLGVRAAASSFLQHRHAWIVPLAEQAKPYLRLPVQRRWRQVGYRRGCDPPCWR
jgi:hypothetical protein